MAAAPQLTIIVPAYNESRTLERLVERVLATPLPGVEREVLIVDDGSTDATPAIARALSDRHPGVVSCYSLPLNMGKGAAVRLGMVHARGEFVLLQDADLELWPEDYPALLAPLLNGDATVVYGSRFLANVSHVPWRTRLANRGLTVFANVLFGSQLTDLATGFKVFRRTAIDPLRLRSARFEFEPELTARFLNAKTAIVEVPVRYSPRTESQGKTIGMIDGVEYLYTLLKYRWLG